MRYRCEILNHGIDGYEVWLHRRNQGRSGVKLINDLKNDESDTILQQIEMRNNSYRTFSYYVSRLYLNTYDPICPIGIKTCYVCQLEAQHL